MKRSFKVVVASAVTVLIVALVYQVCSSSKSTSSLRVEVTKVGSKGHQAILVNRGYLPVIIGRCDIMTDDSGLDTLLGDEIQRWDNEQDIWATAYPRSDCKLVPLGINRATFSYKLLWPGGRLHTSPFFRGPGASIHEGDTVRFLVFTQRTHSPSSSLPSASFVIE